MDNNSAAAPMIQVDVVYALAHEQQVFTLNVAPETAIEAIIRQSGVLAAYPEIDLARNNVGIFSRQVKLDATAEDGDRIEIYRPLVADPKEIRRRKAEKNKG